MTYRKKKMEMCDHLERAVSLAQEIQRLESLYRHETEAITQLADYEVDKRKLGSMVFEITLAEDWLAEEIEKTINKLIRQPKSARSRRLRFKD